MTKQQYNLAKAQIMGLVSNINSLVIEFNKNYNMALAIKGNINKMFDVSDAISTTNTNLIQLEQMVMQLEQKIDNTQAQIASMNNLVSQDSIESIDLISDEIQQMLVKNEMCLTEIGVQLGEIVQSND